VESIETFLLPITGHVDEDGWIWGRGVADCKNTLVGILAAVEQLLSEDSDFQPERSIVLSFGFGKRISAPSFFLSKCRRARVDQYDYSYL
jgi:acetylornithine deacetylase/succinyl-diaminopimelate desuccinylase-like protein